MMNRNMAASDDQNTDTAPPAGSAFTASDSPTSSYSERAFKAFNAYLDRLALAALYLKERLLTLEAKKIAQAIYDETIWVRSLFGALDGLIISYSVFKYLFDYITPSSISSVDYMHDWMLTQGGVLGASSASLAIIALSIVGNVFDDDHKNPVIRFMTTIWPYVRDGFKGLKFSYKGIRAAVQAAQLLGCDARAIIFPAGLVLGLFAAYNRVWYRSQVTDKRKDYQKANNVLLKRAQRLGMNPVYDLAVAANVTVAQLQSQTVYLTLKSDDGILEYKVKDYDGALIQGKISIEKELLAKDANGISIKDLTLDILISQYKDSILKATANNGHTAKANIVDNRKHIRDAINGESLLPSRYVVISSALFGGFIDGLYTYMGIIGLAVLAPQLLAAVVACCAIFNLICMVNRYYEEDQYQVDFERSAKNVELVLLAKEMQASFLALHKLSKIVAGIKETKNLEEAKKSREHCEGQVLMDALDPNKENNLFDKFVSLKDQYDNLCKISTGRAVLIGLRSGIYFYSALSSVVFAYAAFCATFPPLLLVSAVAIGVLSLIGFAIHAVIVNHQSNKGSSKKCDQLPEEKKLQALLESVKGKWMETQEIPPLPVAEQDPWSDAIWMPSSPHGDLQPYTEIVRSACSGLPKGDKSMQFVGEDFLDLDSQGHYQEAPFWMKVLGALLDVCYFIINALRAFGKGLRGANDVPLPTLPKSSPFDESTPPSSPTSFARTLSESLSDTSRSSNSPERPESPSKSFGKFGMWGGQGGSACDLPIPSATSGTTPDGDIGELSSAMTPA